MNLCLRSSMSDVQSTRAKSPLLARLEPQMWQPRLISDLMSDAGEKNPEGLSLMSGVLTPLPRRACSSFSTQPILKCQCQPSMSNAGGGRRHDALWYLCSLTSSLSGVNLSGVGSVCFCFYCL